MIFSVLFHFRQPEVRGLPIVYIIPFDISENLADFWLNLAILVTSGWQKWNITGNVTKNFDLLKILRGLPILYIIPFEISENSGDFYLNLAILVTSGWRKLNITGNIFKKFDLLKILRGLPSPYDYSFSRYDKVIYFPFLFIVTINWEIHSIFFGNYIAITLIA